jgi:hypothetical protein
LSHGQRPVLHRSEVCNVRGVNVSLVRRKSLALTAQFSMPANVAFCQLLLLGFKEIDG